MQKISGQDKTFGQLYRETEKQTGVRAPQLDGPELPDAGIRVWGWFEDLNRRRGWEIGMSAVPQPISFREMSAYFNLTGESIEPWQRRLLADLDDLYLSLITVERELSGTVTGAAALKNELESDS